MQLVLSLTLYFSTLSSITCYFLSSNRINPPKDKFVTVQEYYNQYGCMKNCSVLCYNFDRLRWDELTEECYACTTNCSSKKGRSGLKFAETNSVLNNVSVCCPRYDAAEPSVTVRFSVRDLDVLKEAYIVWEYRVSRGVEDLAPSPWMTILQTRARRAEISGMVRNTSVQFRATLIDGEGESERAVTDWIDIEDVSEEEEPLDKEGSGEREKKEKGPEKEKNNRVQTRGDKKTAIVL